MAVQQFINETLVRHNYNKPANRNDVVSTTAEGHPPYSCGCGCGDTGWDVDMTFSRHRY